jgi:hypothetical protein
MLSGSIPWDYGLSNINPSSTGERTVHPTDGEQIIIMQIYMGYSYGPLPVIHAYNGLYMLIKAYKCV